MILLNLVYVLGGATLILYVYVQWVYGTWKRRGLSYLEPDFFFGNTKKAYTRQITRGDQYTENYKEMKKRGWKFGGMYETMKPIFLPVDLDTVKCIMQNDFMHFPSHGFYWNEEVDPLSANLFNLENERWKKTRAQVTPAFTLGKIKLMFKTMWKCTESLVDVFGDHARLCKPIEARDVLARFSTDLIANTAFGIEVDSLKDPKIAFKRYVDKVFAMGILDMLKLFLKLNLPKSVLHLIGLRTNSIEVEKFFLGLVTDTINYREENHVRRRDVMHLLLQLKNTGSLTSDNYVPSKESKGSFISTLDIARHAYVFFVAGYDTTASTMTFALYEIALNQKLQNEVREEIMDKIEKHGGEITYDAIMEMNLLERVVLETLRRHNVAPIVSRRCEKRYKLPDTDIYLEPDDWIMIPCQAIHMDPEYYPEPDKFDPERFSEENKLNRHPFAYIPFGGGPRLCIGMRFAIIKVKIALSSILSKFKVTVNKRTKFPLRYSLNSTINEARGGTWLDIHEIK